MFGKLRNFELILIILDESMIGSPQINLPKSNCNLSPKNSGERSEQSELFPKSSKPADNRRKRMRYGSGKSIAYTHMNSSKDMAKRIRDRARASMCHGSYELLGFGLPKTSLSPNKEPFRRFSRRNSYYKPDFKK